MDAVKPVLPNLEKRGRKGSPSVFRKHDGLTGLRLAKEFQGGLSLFEFEKGFCLNLDAAKLIQSLCILAVERTGRLGYGIFELLVVQM